MNTLSFGCIYNIEKKKIWIYNIFEIQICPLFNNYFSCNVFYSFYLSNYLLA